MNTDHLQICINTLKASLLHLQEALPHSIDYEIYRNATVKSFELCLETAGKLLRKALKSYLENPRSGDKLIFKDVLRTAAKHQILSIEAVERWMKYRDHRNNTAHDYGVELAEDTLKLLPNFLDDVTVLEQKLQHLEA